MLINVSSWNVVIVESWFISLSLITIRSSIVSLLYFDLIFYLSCVSLSTAIEEKLFVQLHELKD